MAFDPNSAVTVLYGGSTAAGPAGDTWIFDGSQWRSTASGTAIGARFGSAAFFGPAGRVQFVGRAAGSAQADGFEWRGTQGWTRHPALDFAGATPRLLQDSARGLLVAPAPNPQVFDGTGWRAEQPEFAPNIGQNFAYDAARGAIVGFGWWQTRGHLVEGFTWEYRTAPATGIASAQAFGDGCAAPGVQPRYLAGVTGALPQLGSSAVVRSFSRDTSPSYLVVGSSRTTLANGMPLPFVHPLFRFGCTLQVRPDDALLMTRPVATYAQATIAVPAQPALLGAVLYCQEVMAPTFDMFLSNGLELRAGW